MKNLMWLEKGINKHNTMKWVWYLVGVVKLWAWFVVVPKIGFKKLATMVVRTVFTRLQARATNSFPKILTLPLFQAGVNLRQAFIN